MQQELDYRKNNYGPLLFIMILGAVIAVLNQTIMSVAIPKLITEFNIETTTAGWLTTGYMLVNGVLIPVTAYLMRRFTTRELFLTAMSAFLIGSIVSGVAPGFDVLLAGRLIQAVGAGIIMPLLMNVVLAIFPAEKRGGAMGLIVHPHGTAISNTVKQVSGAIGTALLVTILTKQAQVHAVKLTAEGITDQAQLLLKASIAGMNDAYFVVIIFGLIGLLMSFFIKKTKQEDDILYNSKYEAMYFPIAYDCAGSKSKL